MSLFFRDVRQMSILFSIHCERTFLFSMKHDPDPSLPPSFSSLLLSNPHVHTYMTKQAHNKHGPILNCPYDMINLLSDLGTVIIVHK